MELTWKIKRNSTRLDPNDYFHEYFKYAYKGIDIDNSGKTLDNIHKQ